MPDQRLSEIQHLAYQLYLSGEYAAAYDHMHAARQRFPDDLHEIQYWCACLAARMGAVELALDLLESELEHGGWYSHAQLRDEEDLSPLQGSPRFEQLADECLLRQRRAEAAAQAELFMQTPDSIGPARGQLPLLLALHGNSQNSRHALGAWSAITIHGYQLAVVQSSQIVGAGAYSWNDWDLAQRDLGQFLPALAAAHDPHQMLYGGFSMGAGLALYQALASVNDHPRGIIGVGTYLPDVDLLLPHLERQGGEPLRGYFFVGDLDDPCYEITRQLVRHFEAHHLPCCLEVQQGGVHDYPPDFADALTRALDFIHAD